MHDWKWRKFAHGVGPGAGVRNFGGTPWVCGRRTADMQTNMLTPLGGSARVTGMAALAIGLFDNMGDGYDHPTGRGFGECYAE